MFRSTNSQKIGQPSNQLGQDFQQLEIPPPDHPAVEKDWHKHMKYDLRSHFIGTLVKIMLPSPDSGVIHDQHIKDLITYVRKVEKEIFETANDKEMYYNLIAEKIYKMKKEYNAIRSKAQQAEKMVDNGDVQMNDA